MKQKNLGTENSNALQYTYRKSRSANFCFGKVFLVFTFILVKEKKSTKQESSFVSK